MRGINFTKEVLPHIGVIAFFFILTAVYFLPAFQGLTMEQHDVSQWEASAQEALEYNENHEGHTEWTNSMFSGMPTYMIVGGFSNIAWGIQDVVVGTMKSLPENCGVLFFGLVAFYVLLIVMGVSIPLSIIGAIAFAFSSNTIISIDAGHITKSRAMALGPLVIMAIYVTISKKKLLLGGALTACFLALHVSLNHPQITYYLAIMAAIYMVIELILAIKRNDINYYLKGVGVLLLAAILAIGANISKLGSTYEYSQASTRGESPLSEAQEDGGGLSLDYILRWSYGITETGNLLIPNFKGGTSSKSFVQQEDSETIKAIRNMGDQGNIQQIARHTTQYWGQQPMTSGPVYLGAITCYLFVLGLFLVRGPLKWWLLIVVVLSIVLAWGKNFMILSELFYHYFPLYNKFRTVTMMLYLVQFAFPFLGIYALKKVFYDDNDKVTLQNAVKQSFYIVGGFCLIFTLIPGVFFDFTSGGEATQYLSKNAPGVLDALKSDRQALLRADAFRSFIFVTLGAGVLYLFTLSTLDAKWAFVILTGLVLTDLWGVDKRYLSEEDFQEPSQIQEFRKTRADQQILGDDDPHYRVLDLSTRPFNDAKASYYHKTIGGYHGAKIGRYQDLIDFQLRDEIQYLQQNLRQQNFIQQTNQRPVGNIINREKAEEISTLNMLNMKYLILQGRQGKTAIHNPAHFGNAWFVKGLKKAEDADEVMQSLDEIDVSETAVYNQEFNDYFNGFDLKNDVNASIELTKYEPNELVYNTKANSAQFAVFSEIYYDDGKGWKVFIDGERKEHIRVNYLLRGMKIPAGNHEVRFKFEPDHIYKLKTASLVFSLIIIFSTIGTGGYSIYQKLNQPKEKNKNSSSDESLKGAKSKKRKKK